MAGKAQPLLEMDVGVGGGGGARDPCSAARAHGQQRVSVPGGWKEGVGRSPAAQDCPSQPLLFSAPPRPYFCLPLRHRKPCVHVWSRWEDHTWRLQSTNCVQKVAERLVRARRARTGRGQRLRLSGRLAFEGSSGARLLGRAPGSQHLTGARLESQRAQLRAN